MARCDRCAKTIVWALDMNDLWVPLDPDPLPEVQEGDLVVVGHTARAMVVDAPSPSDDALEKRRDHRRTCAKNLIGTKGAPS